MTEFSNRWSIFFSFGTKYLNFVDIKTGTAFAYEKSTRRSQRIDNEFKKQRGARKRKKHHKRTKEHGSP